MCGGPAPGPSNHWCGPPVPPIPPGGPGLGPGPHASGGPGGPCGGKLPLPGNPLLCGCIERCCVRRDGTTTHCGNVRAGERQATPRDRGSFSVHDDSCCRMVAACVARTEESLSDNHLLFVVTTTLAGYNGVFWAHEQTGA